MGKAINGQKMRPEKRGGGWGTKVQGKKSARGGVFMEFDLQQLWDKREIWGGA